MFWQLLSSLDLPCVETSWEDPETINVEFSRMGGVFSNQTQVPETYAVLWNTRGAFLNYLNPKNSLADISGRDLKYKYREGTGLGARQNISRFIWILFGQCLSQYLVDRTPAIWHRTFHLTFIESHIYLLKLLCRNRFVIAQGYSYNRTVS